MVDRVLELEAELARVAAERDALSAERDALGAALAAAEQSARALEDAPIGILCVSALEARYVFSNRATSEILGRSRAEILATDPYELWRDVTLPEDFERERREIERMVDGEIEGYELTKRMLRKSGEARWVSLSCQALRGADGRLAYLIGYLIDVHDARQTAEQRERLEIELAHAHKLEALGRLAGGVAHDFNNRLVIIMGYTELLKRSLPLASPLAHHAEMILASAERAAELTRQLLGHSRRQASKPRAFDLNDTVDGVRRLLERLLGEDVELVTVLGAKHPIYADPGQIEQVILNLAVNARDAMPNGGRLTLETSDPSSAEGPAGRPAGEHVVLCVTDTGIGIPSESLPHIFEPFYTTKEIGQGTGLGLATVESIARQSGGSVAVESPAGQGSMFRVFLPRARNGEAPASPSTPELAARAPSPETLLVCDDDDGVRTLLRDVLRLRASHVLEARNGRHALEVAAGHAGRIDLLVTDLVMPELDGNALAAALRRHRPELRVLFVSGYGESAIVPESGLDPGTHFLPKPFAPGDLTRAVRRLLDGPLTLPSRQAQA